MKPFFFLALALLATGAAPAADSAALWTAKLQPLLDTHCAKCHGPLEQKGGLEVDTPQALLKGGDEGPVLVPGQPDQSPLYQVLAPGADPHMPPKKQLSDAERTIVRDWITALAEPAAADPPAAPLAPRSFSSIGEAVDALVSEAWQQRGLAPAPPLDDRTWARRLNLDLAGRIPTPAEQDAFLQAPAESRRAELVDRLLASDEYPLRMRELWDFFLMGRSRSDHQEDRRRDQGWWAFLEKAFREDRPWPETVRAFLEARPDAAKGASWFLYERKNEYQQIAEAVAPVVYGTRIDCAQCHDHPLAREIKQGHYWGLVAAFNRGKNVEGGSAVAESAVGGFMNFTNLKKESQPAVVALLSGPTVAETRPPADQPETDRDDNYLDPAAPVKVPKFSRRGAFAAAATQDNPLLAKALVNRLWATLLGRGLVHPADEMNARNLPSHPELLAWLAQDFAAHGFQIRRLVRGLVLSRPYGLSAAPAAPPDSFVGALERPLSAEQLARSWRVAAGLPPSDEALRRAAAAAIPDVLPKEYHATFQQAQFLTQSPALSALLSPAPGNTAALLLDLPDTSAKVQRAFRAVSDRAPDPAEAAAAAALLDAAPTSPAAVRDLLWALMTGPEFLTSP